MFECEFFFSNNTDFVFKLVRLAQNNLPTHLTSIVVMLSKKKKKTEDVREEFYLFGFKKKLINKRYEKAFTIRESKKKKIN